MTTKKTIATELRRCTGSARFGIETHDARVGDFPVQPSHKDGPAQMCKHDWRAYVQGLRETRLANSPKAGSTAPDAE
jgi:hypothetical protein